MLPSTRLLRRARLLLAAAVIGLTVVSTGAIAQDDAASDFELGGRGFRVVDGETRGQWQVVDTQGAPVRGLDVPPRWSLEGVRWDAAVYPLDDGSQLTALTATPSDGTPAVGFVLHGGGDLAGDAIVWSGVHDAMYGNLVAPREVGGRTELVQIAPDPRAPACGELTAPLALARFDPATGNFTRPVAAPTAGASLDGTPLETQLDHPLLSAPLNTQTLTQPASARSAGAVMTGSRALFDGDLATSDTLQPARDAVVIQLDASLEPRALAILPADDAAARALAAGALTVQTEAGKAHPIVASAPTTTGLLVPTTARCVVVRATEPLHLAEVALMSDLDEQPVEEAVARTVELALTLDDPSRVRELVRVIAAHESTALPLLLQAAESAADAARLDRLMLIDERLDDRAAARLALALAVHPAATEELLTRATAVLRRFPKVAAAALDERASQLSPGTDEHLVVARLLASLPVSGSLAPLLRELDRSRDDAQRAERVLAALAAVGPRLTQVVPPYLVRDELEDETRVALLRAMLRVAPAWHAHFGADGPTPEAIAWLDPLTAMLAREPTAVQLLGVKNVRAYRLTSAADALATLATSPGIDVVRAEALDALAELDPTRTDAALATLADTSPSVRIAAAEALAAAPSTPAIADALRARVDAESWPEARGSALVGLARAGHPDAAQLAATWLADAQASLVLRQSAARAIALQSEPPGWPALVAWLDDATLDRTSKRTLLADFIARTRGNLTPLLDRAREVVGPRSRGDEGSEGWDHDFVETTIVGLQGRDDVDLPALLVDLSERAGSSEAETHISVVEAMGYHDSDAVRARLTDIADGPAGRLATTAATSLRRLDGEPIFDMSEPVDDLPEF